MTRSRVSFRDLAPDRGLHQCLLRAGGAVLSVVRFRLFYRFSRFLGRFRRSDDRRIVSFSSDMRLPVHLRDPYWAQTVYKGFEYEPELSQVFRMVHDLPFAFLDCGANIGYWSAYIARPSMGRHETIAVEADPETFQELLMSRSLNGDRFTCLNRAVAQRSGESVALIRPIDVWSTGLHADTRVEKRTADNGGTVIKTISIDDLSLELADRTAPVVLKLDVEGMEVESLKGAAVLLRKNPLVVYEDHGKDPDCQVSLFVLNELRLRVFAWNASLRHLEELTSVADVALRKPRKTVGYNFFACSQHSIFYERLKAGGRSA